MPKKQEHVTKKEFDQYKKYVDKEFKRYSKAIVYLLKKTHKLSSKKNKK